MSKPKSFRLISGAIIIAFLFLLLPAPATLVLAQGTEETTSKFLAGNTTAYLYFKPKDTNFQAFKNIFLRNLIPSLARIFILQKIKDKWGIDYNTEVEPWLAEITAATLSTNNSRGLIFLVGTNDLSTTRTTLGKWVGQDLSGYTYGNTIVKLRTLEGVTKTEYYAITDGTNKYLIAAIGNVAQADFETIVTRVKTDQAAPSPLSENAQFQDVRNNLPTTRISLSYLNEAGLPETAAALRTALDPYWLYIRSAYGLVRQSLQIIYQLPTFDTLYDTLDPIASPCYDASRQYSPPYMGVSFSAPTGSRLEFNFYSPKDNLPFDPAQINPLEIDNLVPADAFLFLTDLDFNAWWQRNYPTLKAKADQINDGFNRLENMGFLDDVQRVLGIDPRLLVNFVKQANINENTFNWTTGEFAWARLLGSSRKEQLAIFEVANETELNNKLPGIIAALNAVGISGAESRRQGNFLIIGYPSG